MTTITTRTGKGSALSWAEGDANFTNLNNDKVEKVNGVAALRLLSPSTGITVHLNYHTTAGDGGHGYFRAITGAAPGTYTDDNGITIVPTGGDGSSCWRRVYNNAIHATWFGRIYTDFTTDSTTPIQAAINAASNSNIFEVILPEGHIKFSRLYAGYDAVNNPGFKLPGRQGKIRIKGAGCQDIANMMAGTYTYGTLLESTVTTGDAFIVTDAAGTPFYNFRAFEMEGVQITAATTGWVFRARACPEIMLRNSAFVQEHINGNGADIQSAWFAHLDRLRIINNTQPDWPTAYTSTGIGLMTGTEIFAGTYHVDHCLIDGFGKDHHYDTTVAGQPFSTMLFTQTAFQKATTYGSSVIGSCFGVAYRDCYWESNGSRDVYAVGSATKIIQSLIIDGGEIVGGSATAAYHTGPTIDIDYVYSYLIQGVHVFNPWGDFVHAGVGAGTQFVSGKLSNVNWYHSAIANLTAPIYLVVPATQAAMPIIENPVFTNGNGRFIDSTGNMRLYDTTAFKATVISNEEGINASSFAASYKKHTASGTAIVLSAIAPAEPVINIFNTSSNTLVQLPDGSAISAYEGKTFICHNLMASSGYINLVNASDASVITRLAPGDFCIAFLDKTSTGKYIAIKTPVNSVDSDIGDASKTVFAGIHRPTQRFSTVITADRTLTLEKSEATNGAKFRIVRTSSATGAFNVNILNGVAGPTIKALGAASTWADVEYTGANWIVTASGTL